MAKRRRKSEGLPGDRSAHPDRKLLSMNDWYGFGVIDAMVGEGWTHGWQYCGRRVCREQYQLGRIHALQTLREERHDERARAVA